MSTDTNFMRYYWIILLMLMMSCNDKVEKQIPDSVNWKKRKVEITNIDSLYKGNTYLSIYSEIYQRNEQSAHGLTATVSIRNPSTSDSIFILNANYYNTKGNLIKNYFDHPIFLEPLETVEIVIDETDRQGGTGANFIFNWATKKALVEPYFEAVMITTTHQQGISFITRGINKYNYVGNN